MPDHFMPPEPNSVRPPAPIMCWTEHQHELQNALVFAQPDQPAELILLR